ncbi:hypothetical protein BXZ70DRAFT_448228 [Cristinia sonorae]|uniref:Uncharacterized protein n=1 Tax=Cristinia sonorae TaxID=1940300 RepID=A0A8K0UJ21_9AGAR|nr:hypothetical protein BXZ70DRAFT_448228 [Cristinia sonorae]
MVPGVDGDAASFLDEGNTAEEILHVSGPQITSVSPVDVSALKSPLLQRAPQSTLRHKAGTTRPRSSDGPRRPVSEDKVQGVVAKLPVIPRVIVTVSSMQDISASHDEFYVYPRTGCADDHSTFRASFFFEHVSDEEVNLWVLNAVLPPADPADTYRGLTPDTVASGARTQGYCESVRQICNRACSLGLPHPRVKHVLVIPETNRKHSISCLLEGDVCYEERSHRGIRRTPPVGWCDEIRGQVYVQFLDVAEFCSWGESLGLLVLRNQSG